MGSITGALTVAWLGDVKNKGRLALGSLVLMGFGMIGFAQSKSVVLSCLMLYFTGIMLMCAFTMIASLVQLITPNDMRGRVMSVYNVAFRGGMPFGSVLTGWLVPLLTAPTVLSINGIVLLSLGMYFLVVRRRVAAL
jgi:predicted MFS family arabinose efflux permease